VKAQPGTVDPDIVRQLALYYIPCVILLNGGSVLALSFYKIDRATHERNVERLREAAALAEAAHITAGTSPGADQGG
jgi:Na+/melibiose symporter-like transporter